MAIECSHGRFDLGSFYRVRELLYNLNYDRFILISVCFLSIYQKSDIITIIA